MNSKLTLVFRSQPKAAGIELAALAFNLDNTRLYRKTVEVMRMLARKHAHDYGIQRGDYRIVDVGMNSNGSFKGKQVWYADVREFITGWKRIMKKGRMVWAYTPPEQLTICDFLQKGS